MHPRKLTLSETSVNREAIDSDIPVLTSHDSTNLPILSDRSAPAGVKSLLLGESHDAEAKEAPTKLEDLADGFVMLRLNSTTAPSEEMKATSFLESSWWQPTRIGLNLITLLFGSAVESLQFIVGLKDITGDMLGFIPMGLGTNITLGLMYLISSITINRQFNDEGIEKIFRIWGGEKHPEWEELSQKDARFANIVAVLTNAWAFLSDAAAVAYYLEQQGTSKNRIVNFIIGLISSLTNIPTEGFETHAFIRTLLSNTKITLPAALAEMQKSDFYATESAAFQKEFNILWAEFSLHLKTALLVTSNKKYLSKNGKKLSDKLLAIFALENAEAIKEKFIELKISPEIATEYAKRFAELKLQKEAKEEAAPEAPENTPDSIPVLLFRNVVKAFGAAEDVFESYTAFAAVTELLFGITSPYLRFPVLILSLTNGLNDLTFNGKITDEAIDQFKNAISSGKISPKEIALFAVSLFAGGMIGYAQMSFALAVLREPDANFPDPLPAQLPELVAQIQAWGAGTREFVNNTYYLYPIFEGLVNAAIPYLEKVANGAGSAAKKLGDLIPSPIQNKVEELGKDDWVDIASESLMPPQAALEEKHDIVEDIEKGWEEVDASALPDMTVVPSPSPNVLLVTASAVSGYMKNNVFSSNKLSSESMTEKLLPPASVPVAGTTPAVTT